MIMHSKKIISLLISFLFITCISAQLSSSNLPIVVVTTEDEIPDEPKIEGSIGIIYDTTGGMNFISESFNYHSSNLAIETRGNSTQGFDKKTYSLELRNSSDEDTSVNLFGMGGEEDWILHAMVIDKSQVRIPMSFHLAQRMGQYASEFKYVELVLNGDYRGTYILVEKIKRDDDRVDIAKLDEDDLAGDSLTGGYILRMDWLDDPQGFESNYNSQGGNPMFYQWYYPKAEKIKPQQALYIQDWMANFEDALFADDYTNDEGIRYTDYIDVNSFTDFLLINEFSKNSDGYKLSSYVHKDKDSKGGKLVAGPIWDFDQTYGVSLVCSNNISTGWTYLQNQDCWDLESMPMWWQNMMEDPVFQNRLKCRWTNFRQSFMQTDSIINWIIEDTAYLSDALQRNFEKWDYFIGESIWIEPDPIPQSYEEEISTMITWITNRLNWMDANMPGDCAQDDLSNPLLESVDVIKIYPNPTKDKLHINCPENSNIEILDLHGKSLVNSFSENGYSELSLENISPGAYFVTVENGKGQFTQKIIRQ
jgi:hypothetical protein